MKRTESELLLKQHLLKVYDYMFVNQVWNIIMEYMIFHE